MFNMRVIRENEYSRNELSYPLSKWQYPTDEELIYFFTADKYDEASEVFEMVQPQLDELLQELTHIQRVDLGTLDKTEYQTDKADETNEADEIGIRFYVKSGFCEAYKKRIPQKIGGLKTAIFEFSN